MPDRVRARVALRSEERAPVVVAELQQLAHGRPSSMANDAGDRDHRVCSSEAPFEAPRWHDDRRFSALTSRAHQRLGREGDDVGGRRAEAVDFGPFTPGDPRFDDQGGERVVADRLPREREVDPKLVAAAQSIDRDPNLVAAPTSDRHPLQHGATLRGARVDGELTRDPPLGRRLALRTPGRRRAVAVVLELLSLPDLAKGHQRLHQEPAKDDARAVRVEPGDSANEVGPLAPGPFWFIAPG